MPIDNINSSLFIENRRKLCQKIGTGLVALAANGLLQKCDDESFKFSQESYFLYLCGLEIPNIKLLINCSDNSSYIVVPDISEDDEWFFGSVPIDYIKSISGIENVISEKEYNSLLKKLSKKNETIYYLGKDPYQKYYNFYLNPNIPKNETHLKKIFKKSIDIRPILNDIRAIKCDYEIDLMRHAIDITTDTFRQIKKDVDSFDYEYQIESVFDSEFKKRNSSHAFTPIIASGSNACTLHYEKNNCFIGDNSLILMDIGARSGLYNGDISRTYIKGEANKRQIEVYDALCNAKKNIESLISPGVSIESYESQANNIMIDTLNNIGLGVDKKSFRKYFPHSIGHGLGMSTHESLGSSQILLPGMVMTVEPGIYIREENLGIRLEDDILVTTSGHDNLSKSLAMTL